MTHEQALTLLPGDEVFWTDPDGGACSKTIKIKSIEVIDDMFCVVGVDGAVLECHPEELSLPNDRTDKMLRAAEDAVLAEEKAPPSPGTKYRLEFQRVDVTYATVEVEASSQEEADRIAEQILQEGYEPEDDCRTVGEDIKLGTWVFDHADGPIANRVAVVFEPGEVPPEDWDDWKKES